MAANAGTASHNVPLIKKNINPQNPSAFSRRFNFISNTLAATYLGRKYFIQLLLQLSQTS